MSQISKMLKRQIKKTKMQEKELFELNQEVEAMNRKYQQRNNNDSDSDNGYVDKKAKKWWSKFDEKYYRHVERNQYSNIKDITTSDRLSQYVSKENKSFQKYAQERLISQYDLFEETSLIHVLFKSTDPNYMFLASYEIDQAIPNYSQQRQQKEEKQCFRMTPCSNESQKENLSVQRYKQVKLCLAGYNDDEQICKLAEQYKLIIHKHKYVGEIQKELICWDRDLKITHEQNIKFWEQLVQKIKQTNSEKPDYNTQIKSIKQYLMWVTILKYFEHGHADKTTFMLQALIDNEKLLKPIKSLNTTTRKFFQTDCKICFCSLNNDSNQVLYCDSCNTSFHLACYGLQQIPKQEIYYCDCCRIQKTSTNSKKMSCRLCCKTGFPIKQIDGFFYHITCLMFYNLITIKQNLITLREGITHDKILLMVVDSEINQKECHFCSNTSGGQVGIRLKCSALNCPISIHPICAYVNGCKFNIKRDSKNQGLRVNIICNLHDNNRDHVEQTYLRRYMCNLKHTSALKIDQFRQKFVEEEKQRQTAKKLRQQAIIHKIMNKTKVVKRYLTSNEQKTDSHQTLQTQSRKILLKYYKKTH